ncbi:hypothetical protein DPX16_20355 [Anabarilius grahami]|uniref:Uncharacterized protein n=1 Tax=Anabarilius grahami TaxID=495550 RepID=A0A3N0XI29_ANAGA|nr:hypothetical protein DPX16_20355 [Anabarilius grahami]
MGKNTKPGSAKNQTSSKDDDASDMAAAPIPLTVEVLVSELEKSRRSLSDEFTALLNSSLSPLQTSLESIHSTLASHTTTISEMETALTDHSGSLFHLLFKLQPVPLPSHRSLPSAPRVLLNLPSLAWIHPGPSGIQLLLDSDIHLLIPSLHLSPSFRLLRLGSSLHRLHLGPSDLRLHWAHSLFRLHLGQTSPSLCHGLASRLLRSVSPPHGSVWLRPPSGSTSTLSLSGTTSALRYPGSTSLWLRHGHQDQQTRLYIVGTRMAIPEVFDLVGTFF